MNILWKSIAEKLQYLKLLLKKQKMVIIILLVVPILSSIALGYEMGNNRIDHIPIVIMDNDKSESSRAVANYVAENDIFNVTAYAKSNKEVEDMIYSGKVMAGMIIPEGLNADMREGNAPQIVLLYDGTNMGVASAAKSAMSEILLTIKSGYMKEIYQGKLNVPSYQALKQVQPMGVTYRTLYNPTKNYRNFLLPGMLVSIIQVGLAIVGVEKSNDSEYGFGTVVKCIGKWGTIGAISIIICLGIQYAFYGMPYNGNIWAGLLLTELYSISVISYGFAIGLLIKNKTLATQLASILVLPTSILGGYSFPVMAMPITFQILSKVMAFTYYGDGIRNLILKKISFSHIVPDVRAMIIFIGIAMIICFLKSSNKTKTV